MTDFDPSIKHTKYLKNLPKWIRQRDVLAGEDQVKAEGSKYLPVLDGQSTVAQRQRVTDSVLSSYEAYKERASFMNATGRTRDGLVGAIMRKKPDLEWPKAKEVLLEATGAGLESWDELVDETLDEVVGVGRFGHLVDMTDGSNSAARPFVTTYVAEAITDWEQGLVFGPNATGQKGLVRVNLQEHSGIVTADGEPLEQFRVLHLGIPAPETEEEEKMHVEEFLALFGLAFADFEDGPVYFQEVWIEAENSEKDKKSFFRSEVIVPRMAGGALWREIPFTFFNSTNIKPKPEKPMLLDLAVMNLSHYRNSADLEHGLHFTALPQPWVSGFKFDGPLYIGSGVAWVTDEPGAQAGYLEFSGAGLGSIKEQMTEKEQRMAALGARLLEATSPAAGAEAAETVKLRQSGERSALSRTSTAVSLGLSRSLDFLGRFFGFSADVGVVLNLDFGVDGLTPALLKSLMEQVTAGMMSWDTYVFNVERGELYPEQWTKEEEAASILAGPPGSGLDLLLDAKGGTEDKAADMDTEDADEEDS